MTQKSKLKVSSYHKYSLEWFLTECDEIWVLIEDKFQYNKKYKVTFKSEYDERT